MRAEIRPIYVCGKPLNKALRESQDALTGTLQVNKRRIDALGRVTLCATLTDATNDLNTPKLPDLANAELVWLSADKMRLRGVEQVAGTQYAQTWDIQVLPA